MRRRRRGYSLRRRYGRTAGSGESFFDAYVRAALWSSTDESDESGGNPLDDNYGPSDIASETIKEMRSDVARFQKTNKKLLREVYARGYTREQAGHDFWLTRNGHGSGFWDRNVLDAGGLGDALSKAAKKFGDYNLYIGDDGQIYGSGG